MTAVGTRAAGVLLLAMMSFATMAHAPEEKALASHGGIAQSIDRYNLELLVEHGLLKLYVSDRRNRPLDVGNGHASAMIWANQETEQVELLPGGKNVLKGSFTVSPVKRVIVTLRFPGQEPVTAWFSGKHGSMSETEPYGD